MLTQSTLKPTMMCFGILEIDVNLVDSLLHFNLLNYIFLIRTTGIRYHKGILIFLKRDSRGINRARVKRKVSMRDLGRAVLCGDLISPTHRGSGDYGRI